MKSTPFHAKNGPLEPKRRYYFIDLTTDKGFSVIARNHASAVLKATNKAGHRDLRMTVVGSP